jgi:serine/threonine-protein kinase RsbW
MSGSIIELKIASSLKNLSKVEKFVEEVCDSYHIDEKYFGNIQVALEEAISNAIIHGNGGNLRKHVTIGFQRIPFGIKFSVEDQGAGFDYDHVPNPLDSSESIEVLMGKGIFLIRSLADKVSYNEKGNKVDLEFNTSGINEETTISRIHELHSYFSKQKSLV